MELLKVDCSTLPSHFDLDNTDNCYYWREYTARQGFNYSETNQLITNLKKDVSYKAAEHYKYKIEAIRKCASYFLEYDWSEFTIIPIPPSKARSDPLYDDRLIRILALVSNQLTDNNKFQYLDIVTQNHSYEASHKSEIRPGIDDLIQRYTINNVNANNLKDKIMIFDDVLTKGTHFKAIKYLLSRCYPNKQINGLFIARTIHVQTTLDDFNIIN